MPATFHAFQNQRETKCYLYLLTAISLPKHSSQVMEQPKTQKSAPKNLDRLIILTCLTAIIRVEDRAIIWRLSSIFRTRNSGGRGAEGRVTYNSCRPLERQFRERSYCYQRLNPRIIFDRIC